MVLAPLLLACVAHRAPEAGADRPVALSRALPSVLLVVAEQADGRVAYGAGVVVDGGLALTNLHVVADAAALRVLAYDPARPTYAPMDGGLPRSLFEAEPELRAARLVRGDPALDLAVIELDGARLPALEVRRSALRPGEAVFALGHPRESLWTSTAGVVSALRQGIIQHDAPISPGSSGGPLVDASGRLVGVNASRVVDGEGIAFARPIALGLALVEDAAAPVNLDRSAPDRASLSCVRGLELDPEATVPCMVWSDVRTITLEAAERAATLLSLDGGQRRALLAAVRENGPVYEAAVQAAVLAHWAAVAPPPGDPWGAPLPALWPDPAAREAAAEAAWPAITSAYEALEAGRAVRAAQLLADNGMKIDISRESEAYLQVRKLGLRADAVWYAGPQDAWVGIVGRNLDGTVWRDVECWSLVAGGWAQRLVCTDAHHASRPAGWPPPVVREEELIAKVALKFALDATGRSWDELVRTGS